MQPSVCIEVQPAGEIGLAVQLTLGSIRGAFKSILTYKGFLVKGSLKGSIRGSFNGINGFGV